MVKAVEFRESNGVLDEPAFCPRVDWFKCREAVAHPQTTRTKFRVGVAVLEFYLRLASRSDSLCLGDVPSVTTGRPADSSLLWERRKR